MTRARVTLPELARQANVLYETLNVWFKRPSATLRPIHLKQLASVLTIPIDEAKTEAGGQTDDERRRASGRAQLERMRREGHFPQPGSEAARALLEKATAAAAEKNRGRTMKPDAVQRSMEARRQSGAYERALAGLVRSAKSTRMKIVKGLFARLRRGDPTPESLQLWAREVARKHHLQPSAVTGYWRPYLRDRGLHMKLGRPPVEELVKQKRMKTIEDAEGDLASALTEIRKSEGEEGLTTRDSVRVWRWRERRHQA